MCSELNEKRSFQFLQTDYSIWIYSTRFNVASLDYCNVVGDKLFTILSYKNFKIVQLVLIAPFPIPHNYYVTDGVIEGKIHKLLVQKFKYYTSIYFSLFPISPNKV